MLDYVIKKLSIRPSNQSSQTHHKKGPLSAFFWGACSGLTSFIAHTGSPPYQIHTLSLRLDKITFIATSVYFFTLANAIKLVPYFALGQFSTDNLKTSLFLLPLAPLATGAGIWLVHHISQKHFYTLTYAAMFVIAVKLIADSLKV
ncbi:MAG: sulfite exporter TauE/SafE family protein [Cohaesibacter sp.]|nr:sulfite exporter TauE/SafE family protein [Cohaesibacter sp.]